MYRKPAIAFARSFRISTNPLAVGLERVGLCWRGGFLKNAIAGTDYQAAGTYLTGIGNYATTTGSAISISTSTASSSTASPWAIPFRSFGFG